MYHSRRHDEDITITNPRHIRLLRQKKRRVKLDRMADERQQRLRKNVTGKQDTYRGGRLQRMKESIDTMVTRVNTADNILGDDIDQAKAVLQHTLDICEQSLADADWLKKHGYHPIIDKSQRDALKYLAREGCHNMIGALDTLGNRKEAYKHLATQTSELSKHIHAAVSGRPPLGEEYWPEAES